MGCSPNIRLLHVPVIESFMVTDTQEMLTTMFSVSEDYQPVAHTRPGDARSDSINNMDIPIRYSTSELQSLSDRASRRKQSSNGSSRKSSEVASIMHSLATGGYPRKASDADFDPLWERLLAETGGSVVVKSPNYDSLFAEAGTRSSHNEDQIDAPLKSDLSIREGSGHRDSAGSLGSIAASIDSSSQDPWKATDIPFNVLDERDENLLMERRIKDLTRRSELLKMRHHCMAALTSAVIKSYTSERDTKLLEQLTMATKMALVYNLRDIAARAQLWKAAVLHSLGHAENVPQMIADIMEVLLETGNDTDMFQFNKIWAQPHANKVVNLLYEQVGRSMDTLTTKEEIEARIAETSSFLLKTTKHIQDGFSENGWPNGFDAKEAAGPEAETYGFRPAEIRAEYRNVRAHNHALKEENDELIGDTARYQAEKAIFERQVGLPLHTGGKTRTKSTSASRQWSKASSRRCQRQRQASSLGKKADKMRSGSWEAMLLRLAKENTTPEPVLPPQSETETASESVPHKIDRWTTCEPRTGSSAFTSPRSRRGISEAYMSFEDLAPDHRSVSFFDSEGGLRVMNPDRSSDKSQAIDQSAKYTTSEPKRVSLSDLLHDTHNASSPDTYILPQTTYSSKQSEKSSRHPHPLNRVESIRQSPQRMYMYPQRRRSTTITLGFDSRELPIGAAISPTKLNQEIPNFEDHQKRRRSSLVGLSNFSYSISFDESSYGLASLPSYSEASLNNSQNGPAREDTTSIASKDSAAEYVSEEYPAKGQTSNEKQNKSKGRHITSIKLSSLAKAAGNRKSQRVSWGSNVSPRTETSQASSTVLLTPSTKSPLIATVSNVGSDDAEFDASSDQSSKAGNDNRILESEPTHKKKEATTDSEKSWVKIEIKARPSGYEQVDSIKPAPEQETKSSKNVEDMDPKPVLTARSPKLTSLRTHNIPETKSTPDSTSPTTPSRKGSEPHISSPLRSVVVAKSDDGEDESMTDAEKSTMSQAFNNDELRRFEQRFDLPKTSLDRPLSNSSTRSSNVSSESMRDSSIARPARPASRTSFVQKRSSSKRSLRDSKARRTSSRNSYRSLVSETSDLYGSDDKQAANIARARIQTTSEARKLSLYEEIANRYGDVTPENTRPHSFLSQMLNEAASQGSDRMSTLSEISQHDMRPSGFWSQSSGKTGALPISEPYRGSRSSVNSFTADGSDPWLQEAESVKRRQRDIRLPQALKETQPLKTVQLLGHSHLATTSQASTQPLTFPKRVVPASRPAVSELRKASLISNGLGSNLIIQGADVRLRPQIDAMRQGSLGGNRKSSARMSMLKDALEGTISDHLVWKLEELERNDPTRASQLMEGIEMRLGDIRNGSIVSVGAEIQEFMSRSEKGSGKLTSDATNPSTNF